MQADKIQILSTRFLDEGITQWAADENIEATSLSFIEIKPVYSDELNAKLKELTLQSLCVVFTSINAVTAVAEGIHEKVNWKIFCTGGRTRDATVAAFGEESIIATSKNAALLAERIIASERVAKITFFCGDQHLNDLPQKLKDANIVTDEVIVYNTLHTPVFVDKDYDGILFFSPSAVHSFFSMNTVPVNVVLFSIGNTTTEVIQSYCTNKIITSEWPGTSSLLQLVKDWHNTASHQVG